MPLATKFRGPTKRGTPVDQNSKNHQKKSKENETRITITSKTSARRTNILPVKKVS